MLFIKNKYHQQTSYVAGPWVISLETLKHFDASTNKGMKQVFYKAGLSIAGPKRKQM